MISLPLKLLNLFFPLTLSLVLKAVPSVMLQSFPLDFYACHFFIATDSGQKETEGMLYYYFNSSI